MSSEEHNSYEDSNEGKNSNYEPPQLLECSNRNFFLGFLPILNWFKKVKKSRSVENVVGDVR